MVSGRGRNQQLQSGELEPGEQTPVWMRSSRLGAPQLRGHDRGSPTPHSLAAWETTAPTAPEDGQHEASVEVGSDGWV